MNFLNKMHTRVVIALFFIITLSFLIILILKVNPFQSRSVREKNVIVIVIDALRADHLGSYGYRRNTSPFLDSFAKEHMKCTYAYAPASSTSSSIVSLFTSAYPMVHGVGRHGEMSEGKKYTTISEDFLTLAEILKSNGYTTACISANKLLADYLGFAQGFDEFITTDYVTGAALNQEVYAILSQKTFTENPFFLYIHYIDPHAPYEPPYAHNLFRGDVAEYPYNKDELKDVNAYDGEIHFIDSQIEKLCTVLKERNLYDNSIIIITADHGQQFMEHGAKFHCNNLHDEEIRVPLLMKLNAMQTDIEQPVSTIDIYPTVCDALDIPVRHIVQGYSLIDRLAHSSERSVFAENTQGYDKAVISSDHKKLIIYFDTIFYNIENPREETDSAVYDLKKDVGEVRPLKDEMLTAKLQTRFYTLYHQNLTQRETIRFDYVPLREETVAALKALGYVN